jgi:hypothetical protein
LEWFGVRKALPILVAYGWAISFNEQMFFYSADEKAFLSRFASSAYWSGHCFGSARMTFLGWPVKLQCGAG